MRVKLFQQIGFISHSGLDLTWKVECDALNDGDWETLAYMVACNTRFGSVEGVPKGGLKFAEKLHSFITKGPLLIVDDVLTTGNSMEEHRADRDAIGIVVFSRNPNPPNWIKPIWTINKDM